MTISQANIDCCVAAFAAARSFAGERRVGRSAGGRAEMGGFGFRGTAAGGVETNYDVDLSCGAGLNRGVRLNRGTNLNCHAGLNCHADRSINYFESGAANEKGPANARPSSNWLRGQDLNLRPSGYEPDELPDCSTPRLRKEY